MNKQDEAIAEMIHEVELAVEKCQNTLNIQITGSKTTLQVVRELADLYLKS